MLTRARINIAILLQCDQHHLGFFLHRVCKLIDFLTSYVYFEKCWCNGAQMDTFLNLKNVMNVCLFFEEIE